MSAVSCARFWRHGVQDHPQVPRSRQMIPCSHARADIRSDIAVRATADATLPFNPGSDSMDELCSPAFVTYSNVEGDSTTKMSVRVVDYQGLLHVVAWVLKGMEVRVRAAELKTAEDGMADDTFYITTLSGAQLSPERCADVAERVRDYVTYCSRSVKNAVEWQNGPVLVSNKGSEEGTIITVLEIQQRIGFLLEIASVMSGIGVTVCSAKVHTCAECSSDPVFESMLAREDATAVQRGRVIRLVVTEGDGSKLTNRSVDAVLFTLGLLLGKGHTQTVVPNMASYAVAFE